MFVNGIMISMSLEEKKIFKNFFNINMDFLQNHSLLEKENLTIFGDMYEQYLKENNLEHNEILKMFLDEIRFEELYGNNLSKVEIEVLKMTKSTPIASRRILKWYYDSKVITVLTKEDINQVNQSMESKINQNKLERKLSWQKGAREIVK